MAQAFFENNSKFIYGEDIRKGKPRFSRAKWKISRVVPIGE
jgi:hypothetical protein